MLLLYFFIFLYVVFLVLFFYLVFYIKILNPGAVYFPSTHEAVGKMLDLARVRRGDIVVDFGSGDGRVLIEAARRGALCRGYEMDPVLVLRSRRTIRKLGLDSKIKIFCSSYFKADLSDATVVTLYSFPKYLTKIHNYIVSSIHKPVRVVCNQYPIPKVSAAKRDGVIYLYKYLRA